MKGICFKEPLLYATEEGRKTKTRRIITFNGERPQDVENHHGVFIAEMSNGLRYRIKPKYSEGELVYLKEPYFKLGGIVFYKFDKSRTTEIAPYLWKNKLFMPASAARYGIKITDVRAERLQRITDEDCFEEGIMDEDFGGMQCVAYGLLDGLFFTELGTTPRAAFAALIDKINGCGTWESNPLVWVYGYEFQRLIK